MKIGIMGGTFNPIHYGHLILANEVMDQFQLDRIIFVPAFIPPHKESQEIVEPYHRLVMTVLATVSHSKMEVSDLEIRRGGRSYSIETVEELKKSYLPEAQFFFIVGCDTFWEIATWREVDRLFRSCHFIISNRSTRIVETEEVLNMLKQTVVPLYQGLTFREGDPDPVFNSFRIFPSNSLYTIFLVQIPAIDISSSNIRKRIVRGQSIKYLMPEPVEEYIIKHKLYQT
jgi:nicotinate-nucleotide adenylyltransferase